MNAIHPRNRFCIRPLLLVAGLLLGLAATASAHHGNPEAPASPTTIQGPWVPGLPPTPPMAPGF